MCISVLHSRLCCLPNVADSGSRVHVNASLMPRLASCLLHLYGSYQVKVDPSGGAYSEDTLIC